VTNSTTAPPVTRMLWPSLEAVREHGDSVTIEEHDEAVADKLALSEEQLSELRGSGPQTEFRYRMAWTRTWLKNVGALENSGRGVWVITNLGRKVDQSELPKLRKTWRRQLRQERAARADTEESDEPEEESEASWTDELLQRLSAISPDGFERLAQRLLREAGFVNVEVLGKSGDG
jgi:restriction system protein